MRNVHGCMLSATREKVVSNETPTAQYNFVYIRYLELYEFDLARIRRQKATVLFHLPTVTMKSVIRFILVFVFSSMSKSKFYLPVALKRYERCISLTSTVFVSLACLQSLPILLSVEFPSILLLGLTYVSSGSSGAYWRSFFGFQATRSQLPLGALVVFAGCNRQKKLIFLVSHCTDS